jgi:hypothetical protein
VTVEFIDPPPPDDDAVDDHPRPPSSGRRRVILGVAFTAAATAAGVGIALSSQHGRVHQHAAAGQAPKQPTRSAQPVLGACTLTKLPSSWQSAMTAGTTNTGRLQLWIKGVTRDGIPVVEYAPPHTPSGTMALAVGTLPRGATRPHSLATFSSRDADTASYEVSVAGNSVGAGISFGKNGRLDSGAPREIAVVDMHTGARTELRRTPHDRRITKGGIASLNGVVYWDDYPRGATKQEVVHAYDIATKTDRVVYHGRPVGIVQSSAAGVWWSGTALHPNESARLPGPVRQGAATDAERGLLTSDGAAWAWPSGKSINWWAPGTGVVRTAIPQPAVIGVAGPLVFFGTGHDWQLHVLDTRTRASIRMTATSFDVAAHGIVYLQSNPHTITPDTRFTITRLDTSTLPPLTC